MKELAVIDVDVWADVRCPWCWIGLRRLQRTTNELGEAVRLRRRSFLLEPRGPVSPGQPTAAVATSEWGMTIAQWESKSQRIRAEGRREGLDINPDDALMFDSNPLHRLLKLVAAAAEPSLAETAWDAAFAAHFGRTENLGDWDVLRSMAAVWGLDPAEVERALAGESFAEDVARDLADAQRLQVNSVPTIVALDGSQISGTASTGELARFLTGAGSIR